MANRATDTFVIETSTTDAPGNDTQATDIPATNISTMSRPQQSSPLLKLPPELRVIIYNLVIQDVVKAVIDREMSTLLSNTRFLAIPRPGTLALPHVSSGIRDESIDLLLCSFQVKAGELCVESKRLKSEVKAMLTSRQLVLNIEAQRMHFNASRKAEGLASAAYQLGCLACLVAGWKDGTCSSSETSARRAKLLAKKVGSYYERIWEGKVETNLRDTSIKLRRTEARVYS